jgi:predicted hotdog family 3-hydroxylacyl-ACP dehydratase
MTRKWVWCLLDYDIEELVPYRGSMKLIDAVVKHGSDATVCEFSPESGAIFAEDGVIPRSYLVEYMGQGSFLREQIVQRTSSEKSYHQGLFLGGRDVKFHGGTVEVGQTYWVRAEDFLRDRDIVSSRCSITVAESPDDVLVTGRLTAMLTDELTSLEDLSNE